MKRIEAIIREEQMEAVKTRLDEIGIDEFTVTEAQRFGKEKTRLFFRGAEYELSSQPRLSIVIIAFEYQVSDIVDAIVEGARSRGDCKVDGTVMVTTLDEVVRLCKAEVERAIY